MQIHDKAMQAVAGIIGNPRELGDLRERNIVRCAGRVRGLDGRQARARGVALCRVARRDGVRHRGDIVPDRGFKLPKPGRCDTLAT